MTHGSLFSGIGGFDLAAEWMGWENKFHCEWNEFDQRVLKYYWPNAKQYGDITKTDFNEWKGKVDIVTGGFPCQPYSTAGKRKGKADDRHLWPKMLRAIREISPRWVVGENVRGLVSWNGGLVFDEVQADLEAAGYEVTPYILPASAVNAPHRRDRIWFVAYSNNPQNSKGRIKEQQRRAEIRRSCENAGTIATYSTDAGVESMQQRGENGVHGLKTTSHPHSGRQSGKEHGQAQSGRIAKEGISNNWENFPTQPPVCGRDDGLPSRLVGITFSKHRNNSIKGYGNAVSPQLVFQIFKAIEQYETIHPTK